MKIRPFILLILAAAALAVAWRGSVTVEQQKPRIIFHKSVTQGADVPMRADLTMTWRRHGITHTAQAHVVQGPQGRYRMEYVLPADARGRIVYSDGQTQWQHEARRKFLAQTTLIPESEQNERDTEDLVAMNYKIVLVSEDETIAGRPTYLLELLPRQEGKSSQKRWIDRQTYKTLRIETHYPDGILARMIAYTALTLPAQVAASEFAPPTSDGLRRVSSPTTSSVFPIRQGAASVPNLGLRPDGALGFRLTRIATSAVDQAQTAHFLYSDGIESVSVFVNGGPPPSANAPANSTSSSSVQAAGGWHTKTIQGHTVYENLDGHLDVIVWTQRNFRYTAVSHLGPNALQQFVSAQIESK